MLAPALAHCRQAWLRAAIGLLTFDPLRHSILVRLARTSRCLSSDWYSPP